MLMFLEINSACKEQINIDVCGYIVSHVIYVIRHDLVDTEINVNPHIGVIIMTCWFGYE